MYDGFDREEFLDKEQLAIAEEMFDSLAKEIKKAHKRAKKLNEKSSLEGVIEAYTVVDLKNILQKLKIEYNNKAKKADLVDAYMKNYKKAYKSYLNNITGIPYNSLKIIHENGGTISMENDLNGLGTFFKVGFLNLISTRYGIMVHVCKELKPLIKGISLERILLNEKILNWGIGLVNAYGAIEFSKFIELAEGNNSENIDFTKAREVFEVENLDSVYIFLEDNILRDARLDRNDAKKVAQIEGKYKIIDEKKLREVFPLINPSAMEEFNGIKKMLKDNFEIEDREIIEEINMIYMVYQVASKEIFFEYLDERYDMEFEYEVGLKKAFLDVLDRLPNWSHKGYSVKELRNKKNLIKDKVKIGRNEPCTCGSGKKYKNCCGSNIIKVDFAK